MSNNNFIKWKKAGVVIAALGLLGGTGLYIDTKADKGELEKTEARVEKKVDKLQEAIQQDIKEIKESVLRNATKQDKIYDLLIGGKVMPR